MTEPCTHRDMWFSRTLCACDDMHDYCVSCGIVLGHCPYDPCTEPDNEHQKHDGGPDERIFWSEDRGWVVVDEHGVWECDLGCYRINALPMDAVELLPADQSEIECPSCGTTVRAPMADTEEAQR